MSNRKIRKKKPLPIKSPYCKCSDQFQDTSYNLRSYSYYILFALLRCYVPECEHLDPQFNASWQSFALNSTNTCQRRVPADEPWAERWNGSVLHFADQCTPQRFHDEAMRCERVVYEDQNSIVAEVRYR